MTARDLEQIGRFVEETCGIRMPPSKKTMLESRLRRRLNLLGLPTWRDYCEYAFGPSGRDERVALVDAVTTNKTLFFREPHHFEHLVREALPALARGHGAGVRRPLRLWSAGCSTGEEPYTLAMLLREVEHPQPVSFSILATDVSSRVLARARDAVYQEEQVEPVPIPLRKKYLLRSRDPRQGLVRIDPALRATVEYRWLNFMDDEWGIDRPFHVVFCRNVLIYFDHATQEEVVRRFSELIVPGGYLYIGHSETLSGMHVPFETVAPTVYRRKP